MSGSSDASENGSPSSACCCLLRLLLPAVLAAACCCLLCQAAAAAPGWRRTRGRCRRRARRSAPSAGARHGRRRRQSPGRSAPRCSARTERARRTRHTRAPCAGPMRSASFRGTYNAVPSWLRHEPKSSARCTLPSWRVSRAACTSQLSNLDLDKRRHRRARTSEPAGGACQQGSRRAPGPTVQPNLAATSA
jgi:hypothetical protein